MTVSFANPPTARDCMVEEPISACDRTARKRTLSEGETSNLRTEADEWNHLFVPRSMRIFPFQDQLVRVVESSDPYLRAIRRGSYQLIPFELRRQVQKNPRMSLVYEAGGRVTKVRNVALDPYLAEPLHPALRKLLFFRPIPPPHHHECMHWLLAGVEAPRRRRAG